MINDMSTTKHKKKFNRRLPIIVEKGEDGMYVVECPLFDGCYTQGKTIDEALKNIREVIDLIFEGKDIQKILVIG